MKQSVLITHTILTLFIGSIPSLHSAEQDNWYLAKEWSVSSAQGVAYRTGPSTGTGQVYVVNTSTDKMEVFDLNGTKIREVTGFYDPYDVAVGADGTTFVAARSSVKAHNANGSQIWSRVQVQAMGNLVPITMVVLPYIRQPGKSSSAILEIIAFRFWRQPMVRFCGSLALRVVPRASSHPCTILLFYLRALCWFLILLISIFIRPTGHSFKG